MNLHRAIREALGTGLIAWARPSDAAKIWFELACEQEGRKAYSAAAFSVNRVLRRSEQLTATELSNALLLGGLLVLGVGGGARKQRLKELPLARAEELFRAAVQAGNGLNPNACWSLGRLLAFQDDAEGGETMLWEAVEAAQRIGEPPCSLIFRSASSAYEDELRAECAAFAAFCAASPALTTKLHLQSALPAAVAELKRLVSNPNWLVRWSAESARLFGPFGPQWNAAAYGETAFRSWRAVVALPAVVAALGGSSSGEGGDGSRGGEGSSAYQGSSECFPPQAVVMGCALGYMCLYFRALGVECVGIDMLADSMIGASSDVLRRHGLLADAGIELRAGDASESNDSGGSSQRRPAALIWLNDEAWPSGVRAAALRRAASMLAPGGVVVTYRAVRRPPPGLRLLEHLRMRCSWDPSQYVYILGRRR